MRITLQATHTHFMTREIKLMQHNGYWSTDTVYNNVLAGDKVPEYPMPTVYNHQHLTMANSISILVHGGCNTRVDHMTIPLVTGHNPSLIIMGIPSTQFY